ncbi:MAG TPA: methylmalonyl-CoA mutase family protein, partial [Gemmatimonadales bacterium]|nr:methylmalonyl-CoA mutase family protein [Gemmatimonadales bacterium]
DQVVVGVNRFIDDSPPLTIETPDFSLLERQQRTRLAEVKQRRDHAAVKATLREVETAARATNPMLPSIIDAVRARATLGEISDALRAAWGMYRPA